MTVSRSSAGRRLRTITIDQAIAGASNVLIAILAAHLLGVAEFGLFGIVFLVAVLAQGVARALVNDPVLVHPIEAEERRGAIIGTSCLLGLGLAVLVAAAGLAIGLVDDRLGGALLVLAACMPLLVLQDLGRYLGIAMHRPGRALVLDATWLVLLLVAVGALFATDTRTLAWFIAAWGGSGALSGLLLFVQHRVPLHLTSTWLEFTWGFSWRYLISYVSTQGAALGVLSAVGAIVGSRALGGLQGAVLLVRPFMTFQTATIAAAIGEIAREPVARVQRHAVRSSVIATAIAIGNMAVMLALPDSLGEIVLGDAWEEADPLLLAVGVQIVLLGLLTGPRAAVLGLRGIRKAMVLDVGSSTMTLVLTIVGAHLGGVEGAVWAVASGYAVMPIIWWAVFVNHARQVESAAPAAPAAPLPAAPVPGPGTS